jgi:hypothetical protein
MDNVVAREAAKPVRHDDGSYEAEVELIRLSDGMVVGRASALCGAPDDEPWGGTPAKYGKPEKPPRAEHARRSMAVTRATSRAFRQQYSWIMALAGYEPTPADEMLQPDGEALQGGAHSRRPDPVRGETGEPSTTHADGLLGEVAKGNRPVDMELRETPDGSLWGFKLMDGRKGYQAVAEGKLAEALAVVGLKVGERVTVWGPVELVPWQKDGKDMPPYARIHIERVQTADWTLPAPAGATEPTEPVEAESEPLFDLPGVLVANEASDAGSRR